MLSAKGEVFDKVLGLELLSLIHIYPLAVDTTVALGYFFRKAGILAE